MNAFREIIDSFEKWFRLIKIKHIRIITKCGHCHAVLETRDTVAPGFGRETVISYTTACGVCMSKMIRRTA